MSYKTFYIGKEWTTTTPSITVRGIEISPAGGIFIESTEALSELIEMLTKLGRVVKKRDFIVAHATDLAMKEILLDNQPKL